MLRGKKFWKGRKEIIKINKLSKNKIMRYKPINLISGREFLGKSNKSSRCWMFCCFVLFETSLHYCGPSPHNFKYGRIPEEKNSMSAILGNKRKLPQQLREHKRKVLNWLVSYIKSRGMIENIPWLENGNWIMHQTLVFLILLT